MNPEFSSFLTVVFVLIISVSSSIAVTPSPEEFALRDRWLNAAFGKTGAILQPSIEVVYEDVADGITRNKSWRGTAYQIGDKIYNHGIAFNSVKQLKVRIGESAERFLAEVGLENNDDTRRGAQAGHGSVTFHIYVNGKEVFSTPAMRLKDKARPVDINLNSATEFDIRVGDAGDGRAYDQSLWGEARVILKDGRTIRLQDLPVISASKNNPLTFSFVYGGKINLSFLEKWTREQKEQSTSQTITRRIIAWKESPTGLVVTVTVDIFKDFPAVEWVVNFKNSGNAPSPILEDIKALDAYLPAQANGGAVLHWARGAVASFDDFAPQERRLKPGANFHLQPGGGRSSSQVMPFFNILGDVSGVIAAIGWSGEWSADFNSDSSGTPLMKAGQAKTRLYLLGDEIIRTPKIALIFYKGDRWRGQNLWRQFVLTHHRPKKNGKPLVAPITCGNWGGTRAEIHLDNINKIDEQKLPIDYYWIDAEWYGRTEGNTAWWANVGNWEVKKTLYPNGFKPLSDALRKSGRELMLWFEPERVFRDTPWRSQLKNWLLDFGGDNALFNLGNPEAHKFLTDFISTKITEFGLGCYRQDFNMDPLPFWQKADPHNRQGISEIRHIEGLYAFWDDLLQRHPGLIIDNCASGGRRLDLETLGRATPFWRTDGPCDPIAHQCHTYGLLLWVPLNATSQDRASDDYEFRSSMSSSLCLNWWVSGDFPAEKIPPNFPFDWARKTLAQYIKIRPFFYGDYYPLTPYSQNPDVWMAYQLDRQDIAEGLLVVLRRPQSPYVTANLKLHEINKNAIYEFTDLDSGTTFRKTADQLITDGLDVTVKKTPGSLLLHYRNL